MTRTQNSGLKTQRACLGVFLFLSSELCALSWPAIAGKTCSPESEWMVSRAAACLHDHDVGCAKLKIDPVVERDPGCAEALFIKGWILQYDDGKASEGRALREKALELNPNLSNFWETRGHAIESH